MDLARLRAFHAVAREGSFTAGARALGVSQPAVSAQIRQLERAYGVRLFDRQRRGAAPTPLGQALLDVTRRLFDSEAAARELLSAASLRVDGTLKVGADGPQYAVPILAAFRQRHPGVRLSLSVGNAGEVLANLRQFRIDVGVVADPEPDGRLRVVPLVRDPLILLVARAHPWARRRRVGLRDLEGQPMILREAGSRTRRAFEAGLAAAGVAPRVVMEIGSREAVREAVAAGLGIGVVATREMGRDDRVAAVSLADGDLATEECVAAWPVTTRCARCARC
jgi:aminoethylphosphonate catabolism LysR family transcriptional regulator